DRVQAPSGAVSPTVGSPHRLDPRASRLLGIASVTFAVGLALGLALHGNQVDIDVYLMGGAHFLSPNLYSLTSDHLYFTYPPFAALIFAPLAQLSRTSAQVVWGLASVGALGWLLYVSLRSVCPTAPTAEARRRAILLLAPAMVLDPVLVTAYLGQVNILIAALVVADLGSRSDRLPRGVLTGIAGAIKLTPLIFVPYLFLTRQYRAGCVAIGSFLACSAVGAVVSPRASWLFWTRDMFDSARAGFLLSISDQNLRSAAMRIAHGPVPTSVLVPLSIAIALMGLVIAAWAYRTSSPMLGVLVCATTGLVVSPITWSHHLVWAVPAILWLALAPDRPVNGKGWAIGVALFFWAGPIWWVPSSDWGLHEKVWELVVGDSYLWVMLAFIIGVPVLLGRRRAWSSPAEAPAEAEAVPARRARRQVVPEVRLRRGRVGVSH
ncbi:MAG TPA: glycosyltransferase 87 family protein, partial [Acidimicrobiales bacterium]|nr:glycosyltransferase 87 family protein [Acidimicrobiales bacterium]